MYVILRGFYRTLTAGQLPIQFTAGLSPTHYLFIVARRNAIARSSFWGDYCFVTMIFWGARWDVVATRDLCHPNKHVDLV